MEMGLQAGFIRIYCVNNVCGPQGNPKSIVYNSLWDRFNANEWIEITINYSSVLKILPIEIC